MTMVDEQIEVPGWVPSQAVIAAEISVLGHVVQSKAAAEMAAEIVQSEHFYRPSHQLVFEAVSTLIGDGRQVDPTAVLAELSRTDTLTRAGGGAALIGFIEHSMPGTLRRDATVVRNDAARRAVAEIGPLIGQLTARGDFNVDTHVDLIRKRLDAATVSVVGDEPPTIGDLLMEVLDDLEQPLTAEDAVPPPYIDLERLLMGGLRPGQLVVIGARPSIGKTLVALDMARAAAIRLCLPTLVFSLEMSHRELMHRLIAAEATVSLEHLAMHKLDDDDWDRILKIRDSIQAAPMVIDDSPKCTLARIRARLRGMARTTPARLVVIDYLQLMEAPRAESRERAVAEMARGIKLLAKEFHVPILLLAQLNRASEHRSDRKPQLSDLRESGGIEADADVVILLHREDFYDKESPRAGELDLHVAKNRNGPTATVTVAFQGRFGRAADMYRDR